MASWGTSSLTSLSLLFISIFLLGVGGDVELTTLSEIEFETSTTTDIPESTISTIINEPIIPNQTSPTPNLNQILNDGPVSINNNNNLKGLYSAELTNLATMRRKTEINSSERSLEIGSPRSLSAVTEGVVLLTGALITIFSVVWELMEIIVGSVLLFLYMIYSGVSLPVYAIANRNLDVGPNYNNTEIFIHI